MKRIQKNKNSDRRKTLKKILLSVAILSCIMGKTMAAYGFETFENIETGGFDMDIGEGNGEIPSDWDAGDTIDTTEDPETDFTEDETEEDDYSETENAEDNQTGNDQQNDNEIWDLGQDTEENYGYRENSDGNENGRDITESVDSDAEVTESDSGERAGSGETSDESQEQNADIVQGSSDAENLQICVTVTETPSLKPEITNTPVPQISFSPTPSPKPQKPGQIKIITVTPRISPKEKCPSFRTEIQNNMLCVEILQDDPVQILSFRINKKECNWYWRGKVLLAELPKRLGDSPKAEILIYMRSGKLYHKILTW